MKLTAETTVQLQFFSALNLVFSEELRFKFELKHSSKKLEYLNKFFLQVIYQQDCRIEKIASVSQLRR